MGKSDCEQQPTILAMARAPTKSNFSINAILTNLTATPPPELSPSPSNNSEQDYSDGDVNVDIESEMEGNYRFLSWFFSHSKFCIGKFILVSPDVTH